MLTFVIYAKSSEECDKYKTLVDKFLFSKEDHYETLLFDEFNVDFTKKVEKIKGIKIFLLEIDVPTVSGIDIAKEIRHKGDLVSPIILISEKNLNAAKLNNVLYLSLVKKGLHLGEELLSAVKDAYVIATKYSVLSFSIYDELYRLSYDDICYIKKDLNSDSVTIYTNDDSYQNYVSIKSLESKLENDVRFLKIHRSCIVNLFNIAIFDKKNNKIVFKNGSSISLISRSKRKILIQKLKEIEVVE